MIVLVIFMKGVNEIVDKIKKIGLLIKVIIVIVIKGLDLKIICIFFQIWKINFFNNFVVVLFGFNLLKEIDDKLFVVIVVVSKDIVVVMIV